MIDLPNIHIDAIHRVVDDGLLASTGAAEPGANTAQRPAPHQSRASTDRQKTPIRLDLTP